MKKNRVFTTRALSALMAAAMLLCGSCSEIGSTISGALLDKELYVNEFMALNSSTINDMDGEPSDWIEIYNASASDVNLKGYLLSDDTEKPEKWVFPDYVLKAGSYLVVFASGKNKTENGEMHTNFSLAAAGEAIVFTAPSGKTLSKIEYGKQNSDISAGVHEYEDGSRKIVGFSSPTPGDKNSDDFFVIGEVVTQSDFALAINEITPRDSYSLYTHTGVYAQWVEIINHSDKSVKASDYYLSDNADSPLKYRLPDVTLGAGGTLVVFLTGEGYSDAETGEYHATFSVGSDEQVVYLSYRSGSSVDSVELSDSMRKNNSFGRSINDFSKWVFYARPTPGAPNTTEEFASLAAASSLASEPLVISEASTANVTGLKITNPTYIRNYNKSFTFQRCFDWVELYNSSDESINLSQYLLGAKGESFSDFSALPDCTVGAGEYKIVFLGLEKDYYVESSGEIGLALSVGAEDDRLYLVEKSSGATADYLDTGRQFDYITAGRADTDSSAVCYFTEATPGKKNPSSGVTEVTRQPAFSSDGGAVDAGTVVTLSAPSDSAKIYYTVDGSLPNADSVLYTGGITVNKTTVIRAIAVEDGKLRSTDITRTFFVGFSHNVTVLSISSDPDSFFDPDLGLFGYLYPYGDDNKHSTYINEYKLGPYGSVKYTASVGFYNSDGLMLDLNGEISIFGQYSLVTDQKSMKVELKSKRGNDEICYPIIEGNETDVYNAFVLRQGGYPGARTSRIKDLAFAKLAKTSLDLDAMDGVPVVVYINGEYWGLYNLRERFDADYLVNRLGYNADTTDIIKGNNTVIHGSKADYVAIQTYLKTHDMSVQEYYDYACSQIDIDSLINWWCVEAYVENTDFGNIKCFRDTESGKWRWFLYDLDWTLADVASGGVGFVFNPDGYLNWMMKSLVKNKEFKDKFIHHFCYVCIVTFEKSRVDATVDMLAGMIDSEIPNHIDRWTNTDHYNIFASSPSSYANWKSTVDNLKHLCDKRRSYALENMRKYFGLTNEQMKHYMSVDENDVPLPVLDMYGNKLGEVTS